jgi:hypothetical protein
VKLFIVVVGLAAIGGGIVGGEMTETRFSFSGFAVSGFGLAGVLLGLDALFEAQDRKRRDKALPRPEVRVVMDRGIVRPGLAASETESRITRAPRRAPTAVADADLLVVETALQEFMAEDATIVARGETPQRRLSPHHALKRDVVITAYRKDFDPSTRQMVEAMNWTKEEKHRRFAEMTKDFEKHLSGVNQLSPEELDQVILTLKRTRTDLADVEHAVRARNRVYRIVAPL